jgi:hypothetical protein
MMPSFWNSSKTLKKGGRNDYVRGASVFLLAGVTEAAPRPNPGKECDRATPPSKAVIVLHFMTLVSIELILS